MNNREAHFYLEELQRMMTQHRGIFSEEFVCANGMAILALEQNRKDGMWMFPDPPIHKPICSECGKPCIGLHAFEYVLTDYCPNCGAYMKGVENGSD